MTYRIAKRFQFAASHALEGLPEGHKCARLHGHTYEVEVELAAESLNAVGMVHDYGDFGPVVDDLDHRHLNDIIDQPTAENLAQLIFGRVRALGRTGELLTAVRVSEGPNSWAEYRP